MRVLSMALLLSACAADPDAKPRTGLRGAGDPGDDGQAVVEDATLDAEWGPALGGSGGEVVVAPRSCAEKVNRLGGASRYERAIAISKWKFATNAPAAVLVQAATDLGPDAAPAASLAAKVQGPVLLTTGTSLSPAVSEELARLKVSKVYLVGGTAAIASTIENQLAASYQVERIAGADRYDTASQIAARVGAPTSLAFIASGESANLIDGIAAAGVAAGLGVPTLLVSAAAVPGATATRLRALGITKTWVIGGIAAIPDGA